VTQFVFGMRSDVDDVTCDVKRDMSKRK
jgi:hypothetical protein